MHTYEVCMHTSSVACAHTKSTYQTHTKHKKNKEPVCVRVARYAITCTRVQQTREKSPCQNANFLKEIEGDGDVTIDRVTPTVLMVAWDAERLHRKVFKKTSVRRWLCWE
jgi:hypothetical protein